MEKYFEGNISESAFSGNIAAASFSGRLNILSGKGSGDYEELSNKPRINGVVLSGNKSSEELGFPDIPDLSGYARLTDIPSSLPADGGNADTVGGHTVGADVPENAVFTDTVPDLSGYARLTDIPSSLPADGGNADTVGGHTVGINVPANAKFTDTTYSAASASGSGLMTAAMVTKLNGIAAGANAYTLPAATASALGGVKTGANITNSGGTISLSAANVRSALGFTPLSAVSGVCVMGAATTVAVELGFRPSSVIIVDSNAPSSVYRASKSTSTGFECGYLAEGVRRTYWAFR